MQPTFDSVAIPAVEWTGPHLPAETVGLIPLLPQYGGTGLEYARVSRPRAPFVYRFRCTTETWATYLQWANRARNRTTGTLILPNSENVGTYQVTGWEPGAPVSETGDGTYTYEFTITVTATTTT